VKKITAILLTFIAFIIVGCSNEKDSTQKQAEEHELPEQVEEETPEEIEDDNQSDSPAEEENDSENNVESEQPEIEEPLYEIDENWSVVPIQDGVNEKVVLLTIDDAPDKHSVEMAKILKELNAPAIFFVNGHFIQTDEGKEKLKQIYDMGFEIGNHTYHHTNLGTVSEEEQKKEIVELNDLIEEIIGERPKFFRAPNGTNTDFAMQLVKEEGMLLMNWTYGYDYFEPYMDAENLAEAMVTGKGPEVDVPYSLLKDGANLLMHDRDWTFDALEEIVTGLRDQGYEFVDPKNIKTP
jgi:peptidoglycan-N-acetylmuramic acid deacetylase